MTVAEIKEFINDKQEEMYYADKGDYFIPPNDVGEILEAILNMLDDLEPKSKWEIDGHHRRCEKCGEYFCIDDREGNEIPHNFCGNCGARMNDEVDDEPKN